MDFSRLPDTAFLKIMEYFPLEYVIRVGRVNKPFRRIAQLSTSRTKCLDLSEYRFRYLTREQLAVILDLCAPNLEWIRFPSSEVVGHGTPMIDWENWKNRDNIRQRDAILDHGRDLADTFAYYHCPKMAEIDLGRLPINRTDFGQLIQNCPKMESLVWCDDGVVPFPDLMNVNLKKLKTSFFDDDALRSLTGRCPNLKELDLVTGGDIGQRVLDGFFGSVPHVHRVSLRIRYYSGLLYCMMAGRNLVNFCNLPLTSLSIIFSDGDSAEDRLLCKFATSFPNLKMLQLEMVMPTNAGISALGALRDLEILQLKLSEVFGRKQFDQGIRQLAHCKKLQKLGMYGGSSVSGDALINLFRSCPQLEHIVIGEILEVANPEEAAVILECLVLTAMRNISIEFGCKNVRTVNSIWETETVKEMIGKLEEKDGLKIMITYIE